MRTIRGLIALVAGRDPSNPIDQGSFDVCRKVGLFDEQEWASWKNWHSEVYQVLKYLLANRAEAIRWLGPQLAQGQLGARLHFNAWGTADTREWYGAPPYMPPVFHSPLQSWRSRLLALYPLTVVINLLGIIALVARLVVWRRFALNPAVSIAAAFLVFALFQIAALAYVSVPTSTLDSRLYYAPHVTLLLFAPLLIHDEMRVFIRWRTPGGKQADAEAPSGAAQAAV